MFLRWFAIMLAGALSVNAGSRISFDFGWEFKYYGKGEPSSQNNVVKADASEAGKATFLTEIR